MIQIDQNNNKSNLSNMKVKFEDLATKNKPPEAFKKGVNSVTNTPKPKVKLPSPKATSTEGKKSPPAIPKKTAGLTKPQFLPKLSAILTKEALSNSLEAQEKPTSPQKKERLTNISKNQTILETNAISKSSLGNNSNDSLKNYATKTLEGFRRNVANNVYKYMFKNGTAFQKPQSCENHSVNNKRAGLDYLEHMSLENLNFIKQEVRELSPEEEIFKSSVCDTEWRFRHCTYSDLLKKDGEIEKSTIYSNKQINRLQVKSKLQFTDDSDRKILSNDDFVFFGIELAANIAETVPVLNRTYSGRYYGDNAYLFNENDSRMKYGYMTLTDHLNNYLGINIGELGERELKIHKNFPNFYEELKLEAFRKYDNDEYRKITNPHSNQSPMFSYQHMKEALALYMISELRNKTDKDFIKFALSCSPGSLELNAVVHIFFQPEFHVPRIVSTYDPTTAKVYEYGAAYSKNLKKQD